MAEYNTVPLGQAGTGAAFSLGENRALARYLENEDYNAAINRQNALLSQKAQKDAQDALNESRYKNALKVKAGLYWQDIDDEAKRVFEQGNKFYQRGIDPNKPYTGNNPELKKAVEDFQLNKLHVEQAAERREQAQPFLLKELSSFDPSKHTQASMNRVEEWSKLPFSEAVKTPMPILEPKFQPNAVLDKVKYMPPVREYVRGNQKIHTQVADKGEIQKSIENEFAQDPSFNSYLHEDLGIQGYDLSSIKRLPNSYDGIVKDTYKEYKGNPVFRAELAKQYGITSDQDPRFRAMVEQSASKAYDAKQRYNRFINDAVEKKYSELPNVYKKTPDYTEENQQAKRNKGNGSDAIPTYRQDLLNRVLDNQEGSINEMFNTIRGGIRQKGATHLRNADGFKYRPKPDGTIIIEIPDAIKQNKEGESEIVIPKTEIVIDPRNRADASMKLNNILNTYSDEKVPTSALETPQGKKKVPGGQNEKQLQQNKKPKMGEQDRAALNWANSNPKDPRSRQIKDSLRAKGLL